MTEASSDIRETDPGLFVLVALLGFHGIGADGEQLRHRLGSNTTGVLIGTGRPQCGHAPRL